jgi:hypothetical protein
MIFLDGNQKSMTILVPCKYTSVSDKLPFISVDGGEPLNVVDITIINAVLSPDPH